MGGGRAGRVRDSRGRENAREDRAVADENEIAVIERFLPKQLGDAEAEAKIREIIAETGASSMKDMGKVMKATLAHLAGKTADGARVSQLVKEKLSS